MLGLVFGIPWEILLHESLGNKGQVPSCSGVIGCTTPYNQDEVAWPSPRAVGTL